MSLLGTELNYAYSPLGTSNNSSMESPMFFEDVQEPQQPPKMQVNTSKPQAPAQNAILNPPQQPALYDASTINSQYEQEQKLMNILTEIKKQKSQQGSTTTAESQPSYVDKLLAKKKEVWKFLQLALIVVLALSLHHIIEHYLKYYINNTDLSFERELVIRFLYPLAIIFLLWNFKVFSK
jgi:hypothetical protein